MLREAVRNRLLRRADWRFLLPDPHPRRSMCFVRGELAEAIRLISDQTITPPSRALGDCDLAVTVDPDETTLRTAWNALRPGGICYSEWRLPLKGRSQDVKRRFEHAGFEGTACYWPWPPPWLGRPQLWVPLESTGATSYALETMLRGQSSAARGARRVAPALWRFACRGGLLRPVCALARKPSDPCAVPVRPDMLSTIADNWLEWDLGPSPRQLSWLLLTGGPRTISKAVGLVFAEPDPVPRVAVKFPRVAEASLKLQREATGLRAAEHLPPHALSGIPRLLVMSDMDSTRAVVETALPGKPLYLHLDRSTYRELALRATDWLARLAGRSCPSPPAEWWGRLVGSVLDTFEATFGSVVDRSALDASRSILQTLGPLPLVLEQRDFSPWNVMLGPNGDLAVFDWESSEPRGLPLLDLLYFLSYLAFEVEHTPESTTSLLAAYRASIDPASFIGQVRAECVGRYVVHTGIDPSAVGPLALLVWLVHTRSDYEHLAADYAGTPPAAALRASLFLALWRVELEMLSQSRGASPR